MLNYYIYYRVDAAYTLEASAAVKQIQYEIEAHFSVAGRLLKKRNEPLLWMEIYENVASSEEFETVLNTAEIKSEIKRFMQENEQRKIECFVA